MYFITPKYGREGKNETDGPIGITLIEHGKVESISDADDAGRIKVRISGVDNNKKEADLVYAFPMLPKHINVTPKKGEGVLIFRMNSNDRIKDRLYLGPIVSQPQFLENADYDLEAWQGFSWGGIPGFGPAPVDRKKLKGGYPQKDEIAIQGRKNSDLIFKKDEVLLRAGKFVFQGDNADNSRSEDEFDKAITPKYKFNLRTQGYVQIKYNSQIKVLEDEDTPKEYGSVTNIVSNKINLLTHKEGSPRFNLTNQDNLISDDEMQKILSEAHPLVFGDKLLEFLKLIKNAIVNHNHKYAGLPPHSEGSSTAAKVVQDMNEYDLEQILSKNIRIN